VELLWIYTAVIEIKQLIKIYTAVIEIKQLTISKYFYDNEVLSVLTPLSTPGPDLTEKHPNYSQILLYI